ncbi:putative ribosome-binding factor A, mitochondrial [Dendroctonus ponderosae]|uniref:Ribosome-binding factor A, mitochondrial n=1 Tax=Dendroctonus ponderosae TaxID=77166 RepID=U4UEQ8_DENPD|nr:putative ribosome-binding factor A, mitochondrial [Dendroctonus ponderosae]ERL92454.1 hypothetical protein D910_09768 [Dendroctonus ponderosae]KAH1014675.1 hypothetical protein HUJ05_012519 [Dendroctonus ponderosae]
MWHNKLLLLTNGLGFHTSCQCASKAGKVLKKLMVGTKKSKKYFVDNGNPMLPSANSLFGKNSVASLETQITGNPRRNNMLNKLFMRYITDIMATGEYSSEILGFGIEINKVKVSPDYKILNVYWIAKESESPEKIDQLLKKNAGFLRHELSSLNLMGNVPNIIFVRDRNYNKFGDVQQLLAKADFGEDYVPEEAEAYKPEVQMMVTSLEPEVKIKLKALEASTEPEDDQTFTVPPMPQNVLGLDHAAIFKRVTKGLSMSRAEHRTVDTTDWMKWSQFKEIQPINQDPVSFANHQEQRKAFKMFLQQRQLLRKKIYKMDKHWTADKEYLEEEFRQKYEAQCSIDYPNETVGDYDFEDVVDEDSDFK